MAANVVEYQRTRLLAVPTQLDLLDTSHPRALHPARLMAPSLVAYSAVEDRINRLLVETSASVADHPIAAQIIVPADRLIDAAEVGRMMASIPADGISFYFIWTPEVSEEMLLAEHDLLGR